MVDAAGQGGGGEDESERRPPADGGRVGRVTTVHGFLIS
jgi:hypothetical protein